MFSSKKIIFVVNLIYILSFCEIIDKMVSHIYRLFIPRSILQTNVQPRGLFELIIKFAEENTHEFGVPGEYQPEGQYTLEIFVFD